MADTVRDTPRLGWLDGLRGLAAMQVVLLHYVFVFLPRIGSAYPPPIHDFWWRGLLTAPFVFLFDGISAVYLFFIISGIVLTNAFAAHPFAFLSTTARRVVRLGLPMTAATILAALLYTLLPDAHFAAHTGSSALRDLGPVTISLASMAHQIALEGLLAGFHGWSLLPGWISNDLGLVRRAHAFDTPLWTLHIEFCGSLLIMLLVAVRASAGRGAYHAICIILGCAFVLSPMGLFIVGHVIAGPLRRIKGSNRGAALGAVLLGSGILLCSIRIIAPIATLWAMLPPPPLGIQGDPATLQKMLGAILVLGGIILLPVVQNGLECRTARWLGKISFSLYLTHVPLLFTGVVACFAVLDGPLPYGLTVAVVSAAGIAASLAFAVPFERWIDRPAIRLSRLVGRPSPRLKAPVPVADTA